METVREALTQTSRGSDAADIAKTERFLLVTECLLKPELFRGRRRVKPRWFLTVEERAQAADAAKAVVGCNLVVDMLGVKVFEMRLFGDAYL